QPDAALGPTAEAGSTPVRRAFQLRDVDFTHFQHRLHDTPGAVRVSVGEQLVQSVRHHLPGQPPPVLDPTAVRIRAAVRQRRPELVYLRLVLACDLEGDGLGERKLWASVQADEPGAGQRELDGEDHPGRPTRGVGW